jgi:hypothetical protein
MTAPVVQQLLLMLVQSVFVGGLLVASFRLRRTFGQALLYIVFGVIFQYANLLAGSMYIPLSPWLVVSPGSVVLFPAILFLVLFVYLSEDALEARKLIFGVAIANIVFLPLSLLVATQLQSPQVINPFHLSPDLFSVQPRIVVSSAVVLFIDTLIVCLLYEWISRWRRVRDPLAPDGAGPGDGSGRAHRGRTAAGACDRLEGRRGHADHGHDRGVGVPARSRRRPGTHTDRGPAALCRKSRRPQSRRGHGLPGARGSAPGARVASCDSVSTRCTAVRPAAVDNRP